MGLTEQIKQKALELGFDLVGVTDASPVHDEQVNRLLGWLRDGHAGQMTWMHNHLEKRTNPAKLLPAAKSVIVVGLNYKPPSSLRAQQSEAKQSQSFGRIAPFAQYDDYHPFIKKLLRKLVYFIITTIGHGFQFQICVDSAPLLERALAVRAGLGFIGKNRMLVNPRFGPQIFLGEILTNLELVPDKHLTESCPDCGKCVSACPSGALKPDGSFNATKCISYLTIESDGEIPAELAPKIGNHLFGCSDCVVACPHQQKAPPCSNKEFKFHPTRAELDLNEILMLTEARFQIEFANSPILRAGLAHLKRIAGICMENLSRS
ncbi:MAG: tRNA epoxyqueuosine(34) reductase QueG [Planctomycetota bacterium]